MITGLTYAASQPLAYAALFGGKVFTDDQKEVILSALAILKLGWAAAATYYIRLPRHDLKEKPTPSWRMTLLAIVVIGGGRYSNRNEVEEHHNAKLARARYGRSRCLCTVHRGTWKDGIGGPEMDGCFDRRRWRSLR